MSAESRARGPAPFLALRIPPPPKAETHLFVDALRRAGARSVERDGDTYVALFPATEEADGLTAVVRAALRASTSLRDPEIARDRITSEEWAARWRGEQAVRRVSPRLVVAPVGVEIPGEDAGRPDLSPGAGATSSLEDILIRLDPAVAFGTAEHTTTRACLGLMDGRVRPGSRLLDVGTGSGILAIAGAMLGAGEVLALERDPLSCRAARRNAAVNGVEDRVEVRQVNVGPSELKKVGRFDGVVMNIEAPVSAPMVPSVPRALAREGWFLLSGVVGSEADDAVAAAEGAGLRLVKARPERSWWTGVFERD